MSTMDDPHSHISSTRAVSVVVGITTLLYLAWRRLKRHLERKKPFPGDLPMPPGSHWFFGHLGTRLFGTNFRNTHRGLFLDYADEYGVCSVWLVGARVVSVTSYQDARAILQASTDRRRVKLLAIHLNHFLGPRNIGVLRGKEWKYHRAAILRVFHSAKTLQHSRAAMIEASQTLVDALKKQPQPLELDVEPLMKMITVDVFGKTALTYDFGCCANLRPSAIAEAFEFLGTELTRRLRNPMSPFNHLYGVPTAANRRHASQRQLIRGFLEERIEERRQQQPGDRTPDLLTSLLNAHDAMKKSQTQDYVSDLTLVDIMMSLLFAGYDTTSITLTYVLYLLATNPDVEQKCLEEIGRVCSTNYNDLDPDQLVYCHAVITETLRLYPPAIGVNRTTSKPLQLSNGFVIPQDTFVMIPIYIIQRLEQHFPHPDEFIPERWATRKGDGVWVERDNEDDCANSIPPGNRNALLAFSAGARSCAAQKFALQEAVLVMATLITQLKFTTISPDYEMIPTRNGIVQSPKGGLPMKIAPRQPKNA